MKNMLKSYTLYTVVEKPVNIGSYVSHSNEVSPNNSNSLRRFQDISTLEFSSPSFNFNHEIFSHQLFNPLKLNSPGFSLIYPALICFILLLTLTACTTL